MVRDTPSFQDASHTKFVIPASKNIGDMHRTLSRSRTDKRTVRLQYASQSSFGGIKSRDYRCKKVEIVGLSKFKIHHKALLEIRKFTKVNKQDNSCDNSTS